MDTTVGALKVGAQLVMGKYGVDKDNPYPIVWLKGNRQGGKIQTVGFFVILSQKKLSTTCASMRRKRLGIIGVLIMRSIQCQICFRS